MDLTPQQKVFNDQLITDPKFVELENGMKHLTDNQSVIMRMIQDNEAETKEEFAKGTRKFETLESDIKEVRNDMEELKKEMNSGFSALARGLNQLRDEIKDEKMSKVSKQLEKLQEEKEKREENSTLFKRTVIGGILIAAAGIFLTYIATQIGMITPTK